MRTLGGLTRADFPIFALWFGATYAFGGQVAEGGPFWTALIVAFVVVLWGKVTHEQGVSEGAQRERARQAGRAN